MAKLFKNRKGVSLAELMAAIVIIGLASTAITTMIITSYKGQLNATKYNLAKQMAKNYDTMLTRDIIYNNLTTMGDDAFKSADDSDKYITLNSDLIDRMTVKSDGTHSPIYSYLYDDTVNLELNGKVFNSSNVTIRIHMISVTMGYYRTQVIVKYNDTREVTYNGTHSKD